MILRSQPNLTTQTPNQIFELRESLSNGQEHWQEGLKWFTVDCSRDSAAPSIMSPSKPHLPEISTLTA